MCKTLGMPSVLQAASYALTTQVKPHAPRLLITTNFCTPFHIAYHSFTNYCCIPPLVTSVGTLRRCGLAAAAAGARRDPFAAHR